DEVMLPQRVDELRTAGDQDVLTGLLLQLGDFLGDVLPDQRRIAPLELVQRRRDNELRDAVHSIRELVTGPGRPGLRKSCVGHAPREQSGGGEQLVVLVLRPLVSEGGTALTAVRE